MHRFRRLPTMLLLLILVRAATLAGAAFGATGGATDPNDVDLPLDVRAVTHTDDSTTITYTVETYKSFPDDDVDIRWSLDLNGDGRVDLAVATQWEDDRRTLVATVEDVRERVVARATAWRPAPDAVRVSFPRSVIGAATSYRYTVIAVTDVDRDGETDNGERDIAPNTGFYQHNLGSDDPPGDPVATPPGTAPLSPTPSTVGTAPPAHQAAGGSDTAPVITTAPARTGTVPAAGAPVAPAAVPPTVAGAVTVRGSILPGPSDPSTAGAADPTAATTPRSTMPHTGPAHEDLARTGVALLLAGMACRLIAANKRTVEPSAIPDGT